MNKQKTPQISRKNVESSIGKLNEDTEDFPNTTITYSSSSGTTFDTEDFPNTTITYSSSSGTTFDTEDFPNTTITYRLDNNILIHKVSSEEEINIDSIKNPFNKIKEFSISTKDYPKREVRYELVEYALKD